MEQSQPLPKTTPVSVKPYPLLDNGNDVYTFITDNGINYGLSFKDGKIPQILGDQGFDVSEFDFLPGKNQKIVRDDRVSATVVHALKSYFDDPVRVAVYICDEEGDKKRGEFRQKLFKDWHKEMGDGFGIFQFSPVIETPLGSYELYAGVIYRLDCPNIELLKSTVIDAAPAAILDKYFSQSQNRNNRFFVFLSSLRFVSPINRNGLHATTTNAIRQQP